MPGSLEMTEVFSHHDKGLHEVLIVSTISESNLNPPASLLRRLGKGIIGETWSLTWRQNHEEIGKNSSQMGIDLVYERELSQVV